MFKRFAEAFDRYVSERVHAALDAKLLKPSGVIISRGAIVEFVADCYRAPKGTLGQLVIRASVPMPTGMMRVRYGFGPAIEADIPSERLKLLNTDEFLAEISAARLRSGAAGEPGKPSNEAPIASPAPGQAATGPDFARSLENPPPPNERLRAVARAREALQVVGMASAQFERVFEDAKQPPDPEFAEGDEVELTEDARIHADRIIRKGHCGIFQRRSPCSPFCYVKFYNLLGIERVCIRHLKKVPKYPVTTVPAYRPDFNYVEVERQRAAGPLVVFDAETFEYLALMGRTRDGLFILGPGAADRVLAIAEKLVASRANLRGEEAKQGASTVTETQDEPKNPEQPLLETAAAHDAVESKETSMPTKAGGGEHTCIKDDGGTPNRRCYACEDEKKSGLQDSIGKATAGLTNAGQAMSAAAVREVEVGRLDPDVGASLDRLGKAIDALPDIEDVRRQERNKTIGEMCYVLQKCVPRWLAAEVREALKEGLAAEDAKTILKEWPYA